MFPFHEVGVLFLQSLLPPGLGSFDLSLQLHKSWWVVTKWYEIEQSSQNPAVDASAWKNEALSCEILEAYRHQMDVAELIFLSCSLETTCSDKPEEAVA